MTMQELENKAIQETKDEFHWYIEEVGLERAKELMKDTTVFKESIAYIENYGGKS